MCCSLQLLWLLPAANTKERADFTPGHGSSRCPPGYINLFLEQRPSSLKGALDVSLGTGQIWVDFGVIEEVTEFLTILSESMWSGPLGCKVHTTVTESPCPYRFALEKVLSQVDLEVFSDDRRS